MGTQRIVGYVRVSTDDQNLGPEAQRASLLRWCERQGAELAAVFTDHGVSGAAPLDRRPALMSAVDALKEHGAAVLLVAKRDRLARDVVVTAMVERLVERQGARVMAADGTGDVEGPEGMLMRGIVDLFAQYERAIIRARTKSALQVKRSRGEFTGGRVPYGYRLASDGVSLVDHPEEQELISTARQLRTEGLTLRAVARELASRGFKSRTGRVLDPRQVSRLLPA